MILSISTQRPLISDCTGEYAPVVATVTNRNRSPVEAVELTQIYYLFDIIRTHIIGPKRRQRSVTARLPVTRLYFVHFTGRAGGCARTTSSLISVPQPMPVGISSSPASITGGLVTTVSFQGTSSISISMTRKFGMAAHRCALISELRWPLKLCGATLTS